MWLINGGIEVVEGKGEVYRIDVVQVVAAKQKTCQNNGADQQSTLQAPACFHSVQFPQLDDQHATVDQYVPTRWQRPLAADGVRECQN